MALRSKFVAQHRSGTGRRPRLFDELHSKPIINPVLIEPEVPLTKRRREFADLVWMGRTVSDAYDIAFSTQNCARKDVWLRALTALREEGVRQRFVQLDIVQGRMTMNEAEDRRNFVLRNLEQIVKDSANPANSKVRALELLGKVRGTDLFSERIETVKADLTDEQVHQALLDKLASIGLDITPKGDKQKPSPLLISNGQDIEDAVIIEDNQ